MNSELAFFKQWEKDIRVEREGQLKTLTIPWGGNIALGESASSDSNFTYSSFFYIARFISYTSRVNTHANNEVGHA